LYRSLIVIVAALLSTKAMADFDRTGNTWFEACKANQAICATYIWGLVDGDNFQAQIRSSKPALCIKPGMSFGQLSDVLMKYLQDHPEERHEDFRNLTLKALVPVLSCQ
jgi:hypothetical protein